MLKLLSANHIRLKKSRLFWSGLFVTAGYGVFLLVMNYMEKVMHTGQSIVQLNWHLLSPFSVVIFFCPIFSGVFIGTEYSDGTMRNRVIVGHTREKIYLANFITVSLTNLAVVLLSCAVTAFLGTLMFGWHLDRPLLFLYAFAGGMAMLTAFAGLFTMLSMLIQNKTASTVTCMLVFLISYMTESVVQRLVFAYAALQETGILPEIHITEKTVLRRLDPTALSRIFSNLLSNAVKYSDGDLEIFLADDGQLVFSNTASELSRVQVEKLFDRFYTLTDARKSTGLGLAIARLLTEEMGGTITASYENEVLRVCVCFPEADDSDLIS